MTPQQWWNIAPWQPIETMPIEKRCLVIDIYDETQTVTIQYEETKKWFKKWLPLPENEL